MHSSAASKQVPRRAESIGGEASDFVEKKLVEAKNTLPDGDDGGRGSLQEGAKQSFGLYSNAPIDTDVLRTSTKNKVSIDHNFQLGSTRIPGSSEMEKGSSMILTKDLFTAELLNFEERIKKDEDIKKFIQMSPSIPNGFNLNCAKVDEKDFSTIIC